MTGFCVETITPEASLRARHGILRAASFAVTADARVVAENIARNARAEADAVLQAAHAEASRIVLDAERQVFEQAAQLLNALEQTQSTLLDRAQGMVTDLAGNLFDRLVMQVTPREQIEAMLRRVRHEAPPKLLESVLKVHPDDVELLPAVDWDIKTDAALARGACRLEASGGQWCADFSAAVAALKAAFTHAVDMPVADVEEEPGPEEDTGVDTEAD